MTDLTQLIHAIEIGRVRCFLGVNFETVRQLLVQSSGLDPRRVLMKRLDAIPAADSLIDDLVQKLAVTALGLWPAWYTTTDFSKLGRSALDRSMIRPEVEGLAARIPRLSAMWARRAIREALSGRLPLPRQFARETQLQQLALAISPGGLILVVAFEGAEHEDGALAGLVHAAEWLARQGDLAVALLLPQQLAERPALARILFDAVVSSTAPELRLRNSALEIAEGDAAAPDVEPEREDVWLWPVLGRPHPNSPGELKLAKALMAEADLAELFRYNQRVETIYKSYPIVDLLWQEGRVIVEIDGAFHAQPKQYAADRHRDFQLLVTGYLVLRLPHDEVMRDTARAVEKIRKVVDYRRSVRTEAERRT